MLVEFAPSINDDGGVKCTCTILYYRSQAVGPLGPDLISLVQTREEINDLLVLDDVIDLVIPR